MEELSKKDRAILALLHRVLQHLEPKNAKDHSRAATILENGYHHMWSDECIGYMANPLSSRQMEYVHDVLDMYRRLQDSFKELSKADQKKVDERRIVFRGFDGRDETELLGYARFLIGPMERWSDLKRTDDLNTHHPTDRLYSAMLKALPKREQSGLYLTVDEMNTVLDALANKQTVTV